MTISTFASMWSRWWPAPLALVLAMSQAMRSAAVDGVIGVIALLVACIALGITRAYPTLGFWSAVAAAIVGSAAPESGWYPMLLALIAAGIATWGATGLRDRALLAVPLVTSTVIAMTIAASQRELTRGYGWVGPTDALLWGTLAVLAWGAVLGARAIVDAVRAESAKEQAVARTTVVESELRDERLRADLAHDFHDVMAHSLAVLAAQAEGLRLSHEAHPERIEPVLTTISDTARLALVEVRQLLERVDDDARRPQPTSADIPALVAQLGSAGPRVVLHDAGEHDHLSRLADIAAYRIVQESLTNALRHGGSDIDIAVALTWTGPGLSIAVASPIADRAALGPEGRGIAGMRERARLAGGTVEIDARGDRFVVSAYLPYEPVSQKPTPPLTEEQLFTLPVPQQPRPEDAVAPWIVEATRLRRERHLARADGAQPTGTGATLPQPAAPPPAESRSTGWSQATTVDLTPDRLPDGRIRNPMAEPGP